MFLLNTAESHWLELKEYRALKDTCPGCPTLTWCGEKPAPPEALKKLSQQEWGHLFLLVMVL